MQRQLENGVADLHGVRSVTASIRTGRVLITCHPDTLLEDLLSLVEKLLAGCRQASPSPAPRQPATPLNQALPISTRRSRYAG